jgi:hypothetical protein
MGSVSSELLAGGQLPEELLLGYAVISTVPDAPVRHDALYAAWSDARLSLDLVPRQRDPSSVFRAACRSVETRRHTAADIEHRTEVKVDEISRSGGTASYQVTRLVRDVEGQVIEHPKAMRVTWMRGHDQLKIDPLEQDHYTALAPLAGEIQGAFSANKATITGAQVRQMIGAVLFGECSATSLRTGGGVTFVPPEARSTLDALRSVFEKLFDSRDLICLPMVDSDYERQAVERHYTLNAVSQIDGLITTAMGHQRSSKSVRLDTLQRMEEQQVKFSATHRKYRELLNSELELVSTKVEMLDDLLGSLAAKKYAGDTS